MKKYLTLFLLVCLSFNVSAIDISNDEAIQKLTNLFKQKPRKLYDPYPSVKDIKDFNIESVTVLKRGKIKKEKNYVPIRFRVKADMLLKSLYGQSSIVNIDNVMETRFITNDFDEWEVKIVKTKKTPIEIIQQQRPTIPVQFQGRWSKNKELCKQEESRESVSVGPKYIFYSRTNGDVESINIINKKTIEVIFTMSANERDERWKSKAKFILNNDLLNITHDHSSDSTTYVNCK